MIEKYTKITSKDAREFVCPYDKMPCVANKCMAWIYDVDERGYPVFRGRCGMVAALLPRLPLYTCAAPTLESETTPEESHE